MSCDCENLKKSKDYSRQRDLAKKLAVMERCIVVVWRKSSGGFTIKRLGEQVEGDIVEYIHYL